LDRTGIHNPARFRLAGRGSLAGMMPYGNANQIMREMAPEVLSIVRHTPVLAGVCGTDPFRLMRLFLKEVAAAGFSGVPPSRITSGIVRVRPTPSGGGDFNSGRGCCPSSDVICQFVQRVTDGEFCGDASDRETRRLGGESGGTRNARVHLDDDDATVFWVHGELDVRAARFDTHRANDLDRLVAHVLVFAVGQGLSGSDRDGIASVNAQWIEILDRANDDDVVFFVADDFELEFFPAEHAFFDQAVLGR